MDERTIAETFCRNVQMLRKAQDLTLQELADRAGLGKTHVWDIEHGNSKNPTVATLLALAAAFGCPPTMLLSDMAKVPLHPLALKVAVDVDRAFRIANGEVRGRATNRLPDAAE